MWTLEQGPHCIISFKALSLLGGNTAPLLSEENPKSWGGRGTCWQGGAAAGLSSEQPSSPTSPVGTATLRVCGGQSLGTPVGVLQTS